MCSNHLATQQNYCWIRNMVDVHGERESLSSIVGLVFEQSLVNDSSANTAYMYWGSLWGQTCCSVKDGKLQLKYAPAAKTVTSRVAINSTWDKCSLLGTSSYQKIPSILMLLGMRLPALFQYLALCDGNRPYTPGTIPWPVFTHLLYILPSIHWRVYSHGF